MPGEIPSENQCLGTSHDESVPNTSAVLRPHDGIEASSAGSGSARQPAVEVIVVADSSAQAPPACDHPFGAIKSTESADEDDVVQTTFRMEPPNVAGRSTFQSAQAKMAAEATADATLDTSDREDQDGRQERVCTKSHTGRTSQVSELENVDRRASSSIRMSSLARNSSGMRTQSTTSWGSAGDTLPVLLPDTKVHNRWVNAMWYAMQESKRRREDGSKVKDLVTAAMQRKASSEFATPAAGKRDVSGLSVSDELEDSLYGGSAAGSFLFRKRGPKLSLKKEDSQSEGDAAPRNSLAASAPPPRPDQPASRGLLSASWLHAPPAVALLLLANLWVLLGEDIYILCDAAVEFDKTIFAVSTACGAVFLLELLLRCRYEEHYALSLLFFLDCCATISLVPSAIVAFGGGDSHNANEMVLLRSGRAASAGIRLGRVARVLRVATQVLAEYSLHHTSASDMAKRIEKHLSRHVITAVSGMLLIMVGASLLGHDGAQEGLTRDLSTLDAAFLQAGADAEAFRESFLPRYIASVERGGQRLVFLRLRGVEVFGDPLAIRSLRNYPQQWLKKETACEAPALPPAGEGEAACVVQVEAKEASHDAAASNLVVVVALTALLLAMAAVMGPSARADLLRPIERLVTTMDQISMRPWERVDLEAGHEAGQDGMVQLNRSLQRVGRLLQLGFGEAGMRVVSRNLTGGEVNLTHKGRLVRAIFGFCDIRNFTDCTEVLGTDIVNLVNGVAEHVHQAVVESGGAPNKNIGDAFLLVWKPKGDAGLDAVADSALRALVEIMAAMERCKGLRRWERRGELQRRLPGFRVRMGFGLHFGWSVEGAIGSSHKIDASYLSSSVNLASRLEAASKQYGAPILLSGEFVHLLSDQVRALCRLIDRVTVKGSSSPILIYTYDATPEQFALDDDCQPTELPRSASTREFFEANPPCTTPQFRHLWAKAVSKYLGGPDGSLANWQRSVHYLERCLEMRPGDGPAEALLGVIQRLGSPRRGLSGCAAPADWSGVRALTEK